jgi:hypothetical protein
MFVEKRTVKRINHFERKNAVRR